MNNSSSLPGNRLAGLTNLFPGLNLITGPRGVGKTSLCTSLAKQTRAAYLTVGGILCPAIFENGLKTGMRLTHIQTGEQRLLGSRNATPALNFRVGAWYFDESVLHWGNDILRASTDVDVLFIDELGPLEFIEGKGFQAALELLDAGTFNQAVVIVRPALLALAQERWPDTAVIDLGGDAHAYGV